MEFNELIADFSKRHNVENLVAVDGAASLDIDGIIVTIVANDEMLTLSAEIGEPPVEGAATFSDLLLEANLQSGVYFAKSPERSIPSSRHSSTMPRHGVASSQTSVRWLRPPRKMPSRNTRPSGRPASYRFDSGGPKTACLSRCRQGGQWK